MYLDGRSVLALQHHDGGRDAVDGISVSVDRLTVTCNGLRDLRFRWVLSKVRTLGVIVMGWK